MILTIQSLAPAVLPFGQFSVPPINVTGTISPQFSLINLLSGNNTIAVPTSSVGVIISPPTTNAIVLKAKTTSGDTGINIPQSAPSFLLFDTANLPANLYINAASNTTGNTQLTFF